MKPNAYAQLVVGEADRLALPAARRRRTGTEKRYAESLRDVQRDIDWLKRGLLINDLTDPETYAHEFSLELTSLFYSVGAERRIWQRWSFLASLGSTIKESFLDACSYAVLSGRNGKNEGASLSSKSLDATSATLFRLTTDAHLDLSRIECVDELDEAWLKLAKSIPLARHIDTNSSLRFLADFWIQEDEEWDVYHPRIYPCFDPYVCAVSALACRNGYSPRGLSIDVQKFLEPGLNS